jgi:cbb3-type cytochrome oxidase maturation protein
MEVLIYIVLICVVLVAGAVAFFVWTVRQGTFDHSDRLALLPLDDEPPTPRVASGQEGQDENRTNRLQR